MFVPTCLCLSIRTQSYVESVWGLCHIKVTKNTMSDFSCLYNLNLKVLKSTSANYHSWNSCQSSVWLCHTESSSKVSAQSCLLWAVIDACEQQILVSHAYLMFKAPSDGAHISLLREILPGCIFSLVFCDRVEHVGPKWTDDVTVIKSHQSRSWKRIKRKWMWSGQPEWMSCIYHDRLYIQILQSVL